jgi:hypothetical protein
LVKGVFCDENLVVDIYAGIPKFILIHHFLYDLIEYVLFYIREFCFVLIQLIFEPFKRGFALVPFRRVREVYYSLSVSDHRETNLSLVIRSGIVFVLRLDVSDHLIHLGVASFAATIRGDDFEPLSG